MKKIRAGLYEKQYIIKDGILETSVTYTAMRNNDRENPTLGKWILITEVENGWSSGGISDDYYHTKKEISAAIEEMADNWFYHDQLGWCLR